MVLEDYTQKGQTAEFYHTTPEGNFAYSNFKDLTQSIETYKLAGIETNHGAIKDLKEFDLVSWKRDQGNSRGNQDNYINGYNEFG